ncbi:MAG: Holliday junction branch migration protein RuvA [Candidatus Pacebacteria bacterium]|nr:Holliday junction branch migration protein RuvA [Candidatus Paceibacterota bacterium]
MIGYLKGKILEKDPERLLLLVDVAGVGFLMAVPDYVWQKSVKGEEKAFLVYTHLRQDEISLYGFLKPADKEIFVKMISVSGIGPRLGLAILSSGRGSQRIIKAISEAEVDFFVAVKGLGKKSAQRLIVDLKEQIGGLKELEFETEQDQDLLEALKGLGFSKEEIKKSIKGISRELPLEEKLRRALKQSHE